MKYTIQLESSHHSLEISTRCKSSFREDKSHPADTLAVHNSSRRLGSLAWLKFIKLLQCWKSPSRLLQWLNSNTVVSYNILYSNYLGYLLYACLYHMCTLYIQLWAISKVWEFSKRLKSLSTPPILSRTWPRKERFRSTFGAVTRYIRFTVIIPHYIDIR